MFCPKCGSKLAPEARFCNECGSSVGIKTERAVANPVIEQEAAAVNTEVSQTAKEDFLQAVFFAEEEEDVADENLLDFDDAVPVMAEETPVAEPVIEVTSAPEAEIEALQIVEIQEEKVELCDVQDACIEDTQPINLTSEVLTEDVHTFENTAQREITPAEKATDNTPLKKTRVRAAGEIKSRIIFTLILLVFYAGAVLASVFFIGAQDAVVLKASADIAYNDTYSVKEYLQVMTSGNELINPTALSATMGIALNILLYLIPVLSVVAFVFLSISRRFYSLHILFVIVSTATSALMAAFVPVTLQFVQGFEEAIIRGRGVFIDQVQNITFSMPTVYAGLLMASVVGTFVVTLIFNARRKRYEKQ